MHAREFDRAMIAAWERELAGVASVRVSCGDIFSTKRGVIGAGDAIDVAADAIISPANSFGFMDGGIDAVYTHQLGPGVQQRLQAVLATEWGAARR